MSAAPPLTWLLVSRTLRNVGGSVLTSTFFGGGGEARDGASDEGGKRDCSKAHDQPNAHMDSFCFDGSLTQKMAVALAPYMMLLCMPDPRPAHAGPIFVWSSGSAIK